MDICSLLWPGGEKTGAISFETCREDLELDRLSSLLFAGMPMAQGVALAEEIATRDAEALTWRHEVLEDLLAAPDLAQTFETVQTLAEEIGWYIEQIHQNARGLMMSTAPLESFKKTVNSLEKLLRRGGNMLLEELDPDDYHAQFVRATIFFYEHLTRYTQAMVLLKNALGGAELHAKALVALRDWVNARYETDQIDKTLGQLEQTNAWWTGIGGFAVDACLDQSMNLESLEMSEIRSRPYSRAGLLDRGAEEGYDGLTAISAFPQNSSSVQFQEYLISELGMQARSELNRLRREIVHLPVSGRTGIVDLGRELRFFTSAVNLCRRLREANMPVCRPAFSQTSAMQAEDMYMVELALTGQTPAVPNPVDLGLGCVDLLTGANSSGKTTYVIAAGQLQWLFHLGCWVPAKSAALRPVDAIYTLFAAWESDTSEDSRMGLEVERIAQFSKLMTPQSLVLLNEPMTSTSASEGIEINIDLLADLVQKQVPCMIVTHYNEIYEMLLDRLGPLGLSDKVRSLVMEVRREADGTIRYPYRLTLQPPGRSSYARAIVAKLGLNLEDMLQKMTAAGMDMRPEDPAWSSIHPDET